MDSLADNLISRPRLVVIRMVGSLQDDALQLAELDRRLIRSLIEGNKDDFAVTLAEYMKLRSTLKTRLLDASVVIVADAEASEIIKKISRDDGLPSDKLIARFSSQVGENIDLHKFDDQEIEALGSELFYSWFSHHEYIRGLAELRPLVLRAATAESVSKLVGQVKGCYAFQQYDATYALCRMVIEASVRDICVRRQLFPDLLENVVLFEKFRWSDLRDKVSSGLLRERLRKLYADLSSVVHARKTVSKEESRSAFEDTLEVIEQLYAENGL